jgi:hypothetical protein
MAGSGGDAGQRDPGAAPGYLHGKRTPLSQRRLHFLALLLADLSGTYTEEGVRLWFHRPRHLLGGRTPEQVLSGDWAPEDGEVSLLRELARSLVGSPAT